MQYLRIGLKYLYTMLLIFLIYTVADNYVYAIICFFEMFIIICLSDILMKRFNIGGKIFNFITLLLMNVQLTVFYFSGTYLSLAMVNNLNSVQDLSGKYSIYIPFIIVLLISTAIPAKKTNLSIKRVGVAFIILFSLEILISNVWQASNCSPTISLVNLARQYMQQKELECLVLDNNADRNIFYNEESGDYIQKPDELPESPNIILIFTEGLSQSIISDERNIMPNVKKIQAESVNFVNYYNHTFATYNGISGQLYSGFQREQDEENLLISLQDILKSVGYETTFINVEPFNNEFTKYLSGMRFDNLITDETLGLDLADCISDKEAYNILKRVCKEQGETKKPFFVSMYTIGTHVGWACPDEKFEDGSDEILNKFYNVDYQFGQFINEFSTSELASNTVVIFTTDHATFAESDYKRSFPNANREHSSLDQIPLFFYYQGIENQNIDVGGRNSLDLAPTILDFLDISEPNYFLGTSLFSDNDNNYDTIFSEALANTYSTKGSEILHLDNEKLSWFRDSLTKYFAAKIKADSVPSLKTIVSDDYACMNVLLENATDYEKIWFLVWSDAKNQEDLIWYEGTKNLEGNWDCDINLCDYQIVGEYYIEARAGKEKPEEKLLSYSLYIDQYPKVPIKTDVYSDIECKHINIEYDLAEYEDGNIWFVVWSNKDGQDDIKYYHAKKNTDNSWEYDVKCSEHFNDIGKYNIHVYTGSNSPEEFIMNTVVWVE